MYFVEEKKPAFPLSSRRRLLSNSDDATEDETIGARQIGHVMASSLSTHVTSSRKHTSCPFTGSVDLKILLAGLWTWNIVDAFVEIHRQSQSLGKHWRCLPLDYPVLMPVLIPTCEARTCMHASLAEAIAQAPI